jgi:hypothetical protein
VIEELESLNPVLDGKRRKVKHHQWLTNKVGHPALDSHLYALKGLMRIHTQWKGFYHSLQLAYPKVNENVQLTLDDFSTEF